MSEEDLELRDLVAQTLEVNGVLNKIRAELRANVFLALEEQDAAVDANTTNSRLATFLETKEGHQTFCLVREFLQFFHLDYTLAVLEPESNCSATGRKFPTSREDLKNEFDLVKCDASQPLLVEFLNKHGGPTSPSSTSPSSKKNSSKIPRPVKSPSGNGKEEHGVYPDRHVADLHDDDDEELLKELGVSPVSFNVLSKDRKKKASWLENSPNSNLTPEHSRMKMADLGSLKGAPPLPGVSNMSPLPTAANAHPPAPNSTKNSLEWDELLRMEEKLSGLGFEIPIVDDEDSRDAKKDVRYSYEDDFLSLGHSEEEEEGGGGKISITEEIEGELSLGSFAGSRCEEGLVTEDHTVSEMTGNGFDYGEDAANN